MKTDALQFMYEDRREVCGIQGDALIEQMLEALRKRDETIERLNRFVKESGTTLNACQCGRGKKPSRNKCEVCERNETIERLRDLLHRFVIVTEPGAESGLTGMKDGRGRCDWYARMRSIREEARIALAQERRGDDG